MVSLTLSLSLCFFQCWLSILIDCPFSNCRCKSGSRHKIPIQKPSSRFSFVTFYWLDSSGWFLTLMCNLKVQHNVDFYHSFFRYFFFFLAPHLFTILFIRQANNILIWFIKKCKILCMHTHTHTNARGNFNATDQNLNSITELFDDRL